METEKHINTAFSKHNSVIEKIEVKDEKVVNERKISTNYTLQRFRATIEKMVKAKLLTIDEKHKIVEIYNNMYEREIGGKLEL